MKKPDLGKSDWWKFLLVFLVVVGGLFLWSQAKAADITLTWDRDSFAALEYEIWIDGKVSESIYGRSDSAMINVPRGTHCFKMRKIDLNRRYGPFSDEVCLNASELMEIYLPFDGSYI